MKSLDHDGDKFIAQKKKKKKIKTLFDFTIAHLSSNAHINNSPPQHHKYA